MPLKTRADILRTIEPQTRWLPVTSTAAVSAILENIERSFLWDLYYWSCCACCSSAACPGGRYSRTWGYVPSGVMGLLLVILLVLLFAGYVPTSL
jgi:hypothetical protein